MGPTPPLSKYTLEKTESVIKNGQSRDTGKLGYTRHRKKTNKAKKYIYKKIRNTEN